MKGEKDTSNNKMYQIIENEKNTNFISCNFSNGFSYKNHKGKRCEYFQNRNGQIFNPKIKRINDEPVNRKLK